MNTKPVQVINQSTTSKETKLFLYLEDYYNIKKGQLVFEEFNPYGSSMGLHLNFISTDPNEEIKEGEICLRDYGMGHELVTYKSEYGNTCKKIIASTDPSLGLPAIPLTWIRDVYVPSNGSIKEVRLETEPYLIRNGDNTLYYDIKLTPNNEVVIVEPNVEVTLKKEMSQNERFAYISTYILRHCPDKLKAIRNWLNTYNLDSIDQELKDTRILDNILPQISRGTFSIDQELNKHKHLFKDCEKLSYQGKVDYLKKMHGIVIRSNHINQELEDAAKDYAIQNRLMDKHFKYSVLPTFKAGANWKAQQSANDAIMFFNWVKQEYREFDTIMENNKPVTSYVHRSNGGVPSRIEKLYELWQQNKNK